MADDQNPTETQEATEPELVVTFKNGALAKLKELARKLDISDENAGDVLIKGMKIIDLANDGKLVIENGKERLEIDLKRL